MIKDLSICELYDLYGELLTAKQAELIRQFYCDDLSLGEIAENEGVTRQAAHDAISKGVTALKEYEDKLKLNNIYHALSELNGDMDKSEILGGIQKILRLKEE